MMKTTFAGLVIFVVLLQSGCSLFQKRLIRLNQKPVPLGSHGSQASDSSDRSKTSSSSGMDRLNEIEHFLQAPGTGSNTNHEGNQVNPGSVATLSMEQLHEIEQHFQKPDIQPSEIPEVKPGQHVCVFTRSTVFRTPTAVRHSIEQIAGTIISVDENVLVLNNAVKLTEGRTATGTPVVSKLPYVSRLFKNSGMGRDAIAIPGEVSISRSEIQVIDALSSEDLAALQQHADSARIGVDFDVSSNVQ